MASTAQAPPMQGVGSNCFWGFSPSFDLQDAPGGSADAAAEPGAPLTILTCGEGDIRNIFRTIAQLRRHPARKLEFVVLERKMEQIARQILLFHIALDESLPLREREQLFLEIFGNCYLRQKSAEYLEAVVPELIKLVTSGGAKWQDLLHVGGMKHKCRDELEDIFKSWLPKHPFDVETYRDERLRALYGTRYDSRANVLDWDYHMSLAKMASIIHPHEYRAWRQRGQAFTIRDRLVHLPEATIPNRTLGSWAEGKERGRGSVERRGYWGDIVNSPYVAFGVTCNDHSLFKCANKAHNHNSQDISEYNVISMMHELATGEGVDNKVQAIELGATGIDPSYESAQPEPEPEPEGEADGEGASGGEADLGTQVVLHPRIPHHLTWKCARGRDVMYSGGSRCGGGGEGGGGGRERGRGAAAPDPRGSRGVNQLPLRQSSRRAQKVQVPLTHAHSLAPHNKFSH